MRNTDEICKSSVNILDKPVEDILLKGIKENLKFFYVQMNMNWIICLLIRFMN